MGDLYASATLAARLGRRTQSAVKRRHLGTQRQRDSKVRSVMALLVVAHSEATTLAIGLELSKQRKLNRSIAANSAILASPQRRWRPYFKRQ